MKPELTLNQTLYGEKSSGVKRLLLVLLVQWVFAHLTSLKLRDQARSWEDSQSISCFVQLCSVEQLQNMHGAIQQQLFSSTTLRPNRGSVGSLDGGRVFNDAMAWITQQKVSSSYLGDI